MEARDELNTLLRRTKEDIAKLEELASSLLGEVETYQRLHNDAIRYAVNNTNGSRHAINTIRVLQGMDTLPTPSP